MGAMDSRPEPSLGRAAVLPVVSLAVSLAVATLLGGCSQGESGQAGDRPAVLVRVAAVERGTVPFVGRAPGLVVARETVTVHSRIDSQIMEVHFREGDLVEAGQLLFTLDDRALRADLRRQKATLATAQAELHNATRQYERARKLAADGFESTAQLDQARADFEAADARTRATQAEIERLEVLLGYTRIEAAISGRAGAITTTVGNTVKGNDLGQPLVVINAVSPILVQFGLPQQVLGALRAQVAAGRDSAHVILDGVRLPEEGRIQFIDNNINRTTGSFEARAEFVNADETLWPGMLVEVLVSLGADVDALFVPEVAVQHGPDGDFVFVIEDAVARPRPVRVRRYGDGLAVLDEGVEAGQKVAIDGMMSLSEGTAVEVSRPGGVGDRTVDAATEESSGR